MLGAAAAVLLAAAAATAAAADDAASLAKRSAIVVSGTVTHVHASGEPLLAPSDATVVVSVTTMYAGAQFAGDQAGRTVTVVLAHPGSLHAGMRATFFGNPGYVGKGLTIVDEGEIVTTSAAPAPGTAAGVRARRDAPIRERLAVADLVLRGTVQSVRALQPPPPPPAAPAAEAQEHDPQWQIATVHVDAAARGANVGATVRILFPASRDVAWYSAPKLRARGQAVFLAHLPTATEIGALAGLDDPAAHGIPIVTHPYDVLPAQDAAHVFQLLHT